MGRDAHLESVYEPGNATQRARHSMPRCNAVQPIQNSSSVAIPFITIQAETVMLYRLTDYPEH
jgi:hypothetical protein